MTEDQANQTRCCGPEGCGGNSANEAERYCIASRCMAWRWSVAHIDDSGFALMAGKHIAGIRAQETRKIVGGFCGLAGAPS